MHPKVIFLTLASILAGVSAQHGRHEDLTDEGVIVKPMDLAPMAAAAAADFGDQEAAWTGEREATHYDGSNEMDEEATLHEAGSEDSTADHVDVTGRLAGYQHESSKERTEDVSQEINDNFSDSNINRLANLFRVAKGAEGPLAAAPAPSASTTATLTSPRTSSTSTRPPPTPSSSWSAISTDDDDSYWIYVPIQKYPITWSVGLQAALFMIFGLCLVFAGHKWFKAILFLYGFGIGAGLTVVGLLFGNFRLWVYIVVPVLVGIVIGLIMSLLWRIGIFFVGCSLGFWFGLFLEVIFSGFWKHALSQKIVTGILALTGGIIAQFFDMQVAILSTAFSGSYFTFIGLDFLAQCGFNQILNNIRLGYDPDFGLEGKGWIGILVALLALAVIGCVWQWQQVKKYGHSLSVMQGRKDWGVKDRGVNGQQVEVPSTFSNSPQYQPVNVQKV
ncbi:hypothetical protein BC830DRAFT_1080584 [Chytriomyces sp. MP71]|nr:hypothetical protein BC830DRAFT_1080584 [Chytriomyces sp. MP71]